jgi:hypothetical protein
VLCLEAECTVVTACFRGRLIWVASSYTVSEAVSILLRVFVQMFFAQKKGEQTYFKQLCDEHHVSTIKTFASFPPSPYFSDGRPVAEWVYFGSESKLMSWVDAEQNDADFRHLLDVIRGMGEDSSVVSNETLYQYFVRKVSFFFPVVFVCLIVWWTGSGPTRFEHGRRSVCKDLGERFVQAGRERMHSREQQALCWGRKLHFGTFDATARASFGQAAGCVHRRGGGAGEAGEGWPCGGANKEGNRLFRA